MWRHCQIELFEIPRVILQIPCEDSQQKLGFPYACMLVVDCIESSLIPDSLRLRDQPSAMLQGLLSSITYKAIIDSQNYAAALILDKAETSILNL